jgi:hypothetical protein
VYATSRWARRCAAVLSALIFALVVVGCADDNDADRTIDSDSEDGSYYSIRMETWSAVRDAYREGRLGETEVVLASMREVAEGRTWEDASGRPADARFYLGDGSLKHINDMTVTEELAFFEWVDETRLVQEEIGETLARIRVEYLERRKNEPEPLRH